MFGASIRKTKPEDWQLMAALAAACAPPLRPNQEMAYWLWLNKFEHLSFLVEKDSKPIGYALALQRGEQAWWLHQVGIINEHRKQGLGSLLMGKLLFELQQSGAKSLGLRVNEGSPAVDWYKAMGFQVCATEKILGTLEMESRL